MQQTGGEKIKPGLGFLNYTASAFFKAALILLSGSGLISSGNLRGGGSGGKREQPSGLGS